MKPYIYKVTEKGTGEFYIGSQCRGKVIGENYFTSSTNKSFKEKLKSNPAQFGITIIGTFTNPEACVLQENVFIKNYIKNPLCLNKSYIIGKKRQFNMSGFHHSEETEIKIAESNKGKFVSKETKIKLSESHKGQIISAETRKKISESLKNSPYYYSRRRVICVETQVIYNSITEAAISVNASSSHITECAKHQRKTIKGFHWEYAD